MDLYHWRSTASAEEIAALYKQRWQIEFFFKWIKQNLKIKRFVGRSENAVKIQVLVAMIAYLFLRITQIVEGCTVSLQKKCRLVAVSLASCHSILALLHPSSSPQPSTKQHGGQQGFHFVGAQPDSSELKHKILAIENSKSTYLSIDYRLTEYNPILKRSILWRLFP